ncbi:MAG: hypothetical protein J0L92_27825 [Deltaproteobacteria bacterium]|nr:hypothetical protein [Deltaproteobacteria bacterium]
MTSRSTSNVLRGLAHTAAIAPVAIFSLACLVGGERAETGVCPTGEVCADATPSGLTFVSTGTFDLLERHEPAPVIDAIAVGGRAEIGFLGLRDTNDALLPHTARVSDGGVLSLRDGDGVFGANGNVELDVDGYAELTGVTAGTTSVRVVHPTTRELFDRLDLHVVALDDVRVQSASTTDPIFAGCPGAIGVQLFGDGIRAMDEDMRVEIEGATSSQRQSWDRVLVTPGDDTRELTVTVHAGGEEFVRSLAVVTLEARGRTTCPAAI